MAWERQDGIWSGGWKPGDWVELAGRYAQAADRVAGSDSGLAAKAANVRDRVGLAAVRDEYLRTRRRVEFLQSLPAYDLAGLGAMIRSLRDSEGSRYPQAEKHLASLADLERQAGDLADRPDQLTGWTEAVAALRRRALIRDNPRLNAEKLLFVRRLTYSANHYYTEYINSRLDARRQPVRARPEGRLGPGTGAAAARAACSSGSTCRSTPSGSCLPGRRGRRSATASTKSTSTARACGN